MGDKKKGIVTGSQEKLFEIIKALDVLNTNYRIEKKSVSPKDAPPGFRHFDWVYEVSWDWEGD